MKNIAEMRSYSQFGEDVEILSFFPNGHPGFFIEVGANNGVRDSNTLLLEKNGWRGILVEANPELAKAASAHRSQSKVVNAAASSRDSASIQFLKVSHVTDNLDGLSGIDLAQETIDRIHQLGGKIEEVAVPEMSLDSMLKQFWDTPKQVDFLSIDIEGHELEALKGFSLNTYLPKLLLIEDNSRGVDKTVPQYLKQNGYLRFHRTGWNDWYAPTTVVSSQIRRRIKLFVRLLKWKIERKLTGKSQCNECI